MNDRRRNYGRRDEHVQRQRLHNSAAMNAVPPPSSLCTTNSNRNVNNSYLPNYNIAGSSGIKTVSKHGYSTLESINQYTNSKNLLGKRKNCTEDDYFDDDDEQIPEQMYQPAPGSPGVQHKSSTKDNMNDDKIKHTNDDNDDDDDDEIDPLDQFMAGIEQQVQRESKQIITNIAIISNTTAPTTTTITVNNITAQQKGVRADIDEEDDEESYYRYMEDNPTAGLRDDTSDQEIEYDEDGNPIAPPRKKDIDPLPPIYHSEIDYEPFEKNFYEPHEEIAALEDDQVQQLRKTLGVKVSGLQPCKPVTSFAHFGFDEQLIKAIRHAEYTQPSPIQAQAVPTALSGRDIIGIAKTGSGKTAAFIWPMLIHIMAQHELKAGDGPIALILAPTRELSLQIYNEAKRFGKVYGIGVVCCYGGGSKWEQSKALEQGAEIVVATPGRMIDMIRMKATNLLRVTFLVLDEADRMFNMGFEPQVRSICNHVRPDRQTLLFSATFKKRIERLARDILIDPIRIVQGDLNEANQDVTQYVHVFKDLNQKWQWLIGKLVQLLSEGSVLIFVTKKADAETVAHNLMIKEWNCLLLHGDMDQADRNKVITQFKKRECEILVATDVASRGLDIPHIRNVVNYDIARDIDTHTHRIGRTGRAGEKGNAYTLLTEKDKEFAGHLVRNLEGADQIVPEQLMELALKSSWFRSSRFKQNKAKKLSVGGTGLGYRKKQQYFKGNNDTLPTTAPSTATINNTTQDCIPSNRVTKTTNTNDRYATMREAFRAQYVSQFCASSDRTWEETVPAAGVFASPPPPPPPPAAGAASAPITTNDNNTQRVKKRSRWN